MSDTFKNFDLEVKKINSWNLTYSQKATIIYPTKLKELKKIIKILKKIKKNFIIRTGKCSYDSKSILSDKNGIIISLRKFNKIIHVNKKKKTVSVESGAKVSDVIYRLKRSNLTLFSVPGGDNISIGGAISANVIGKDSNQLFGSFGDTIKYLKIISYKGVVKELNNNSARFNKYIGSFGMFGIILEAKIKTKKIISNNLLIETQILKNITEVKKELKKSDEYKYVQIDPFFRKNNFAIIVKGNHVDNSKNNYKRKNLKANFIEILLFRISSFFVNFIIWKIFYKIFFALNGNKKRIVDIHNFHYNSKYKHMVPLICKGGLIDYEILIQKNFNRLFLEIKNFLTENNLAPIYIIVKKLFKSKKKFFYSFNNNAYSIAISFRLNNLKNEKKNKFELLLKKRKLLLNLSKTDSKFIKKTKEICSKENKIFMSLYKKMLINRKYEISR